jgi:hypothetical protein
MSDAASAETDRNIELWKIKRVRPEGAREAPRRRRRAPERGSESGPMGAAALAARAPPPLRARRWMARAGGALPQRSRRDRRTAAARPAHGARPLTAALLFARAPPAVRS